MPNRANGREPDPLGEGIRRERTRRKLTQAFLARRAGLSTSALCEIETGAKDPSIQSLRRIAKALDVPVFRFLTDGGPRQTVVRLRDRKKLVFPSSKLTYELLVPDPAAAFEMFVFQMGRGAASDLQSHSGDECLLVLSGILEMEIEGQIHLLKPGDSIYIRSRLRHRSRTIGRAGMVGVGAISPPGF
jgi:transcriptional regulator with XRE-family HTH domain